MFPYLTGLILLLSFDNPWIYPISLFLMGTTNGFGSTLNNAVQAEKLDIQYIGSVRSAFSAMILISTALGPALLWILLNLEVSFHQILLFCVEFLTFINFYSFRILPAITWFRMYFHVRQTVKSIT